MTSISDIKTTAEVILPGWNGEPFACVLRRPSILSLAARGALTNPLMKVARKLFYSGVSTENGDLADEGRVLTEIAKAALVHPTFDELAEHGIELTDEQLITIFQYTQSGPKALARFREYTTADDNAGNGAKVSKKAKRDTAD